MKREELLSAIKAVMLGVERSGTAGTDFLLFDDDWIRSYKDEISISYPLVTGITTAVRAEELFKILSKTYADEEVVLSLEKDGKLHVKIGKTTIKMNPLQKEQITHSLERAWGVQTDDLEWFFLPGGFQDGMELCVFSAGVTPALEVLAGVHFSGNRVISTDNYRVSVFNMDGEIAAKFTIPTKMVEGLIKLNTKFETMSISRAWVHFANREGAIFSSRIMSGEYPIDRVMGIFEQMKFDMGVEPYELPKGLETPIERAKILAGSELDGWERLTKISLSYKNKELLISAQKEAGEIIDRISWETKHMNEGIELKVQPDFFKKVIGITRVFRLSPIKKSVLFSSEKFNHIMVATVD
jgi:hypothetical protein